MQGFAHKPEVSIFDSAVGILPGVVESDGVEGAVHQGRINLFQDNLPHVIGGRKTHPHLVPLERLHRAFPMCCSTSLQVGMT